MQSDFIKWLFDWQTLIGAAIGGTMGFIGAYWVAHSARVRDEIVAGKIIIADLLSVQEKTRVLDNLVNSIKDEDDKERKFVLSYLHRKPILSPLFDTYMATIMSCSYELSVHLALLRKIYLNVEESLIKIEGKISKAEESGTKIKLTTSDTADIETIYKGVHYTSTLSKCIIPIIETMIISNFRCFNRCFSCSHECSCHQTANVMNKPKENCL